MIKQPNIKLRWPSWQTTRYTGIRILVWIACIHIEELQGWGRDR